MKTFFIIFLIAVYTAGLLLIIGGPMYWAGHRTGYTQAVRFYDSCGDSRGSK